jgi:hypothetical protein
MHSRQERFALNESLFRRANERILDAAEERDAHGGPIEFYCECGNRNCLERIRLTQAAYRSVRADPAQFVIVPGHAAPYVEVVVERHEDHLIVRKIGDAARMATDEAPEDGG